MRVFSRTTRRITDSVRRQPRARLWAVAGVAVLGFLITLEISVRRYGLPGPLTNQVQEVIS
ncbi:DUF5933 domain-containing protein, partial [Streptomyces adelaidensis]|uniref:DUF5933 domain-containing protein n=1 Tax=Streptomyces adelaidensis TaxID=2796465 RepID=UPI001F322FB7